MSTPNFEIEDKNGRRFWISRSIVVVPVVFTLINDELYTVIEKRGHTVSCSGRWSVPCGYLDYDETLEEACIREIKEETGVDVDIENLYFIGYNSTPEGNKQNVSMRFCCFVPNNVGLDISKISTKDEVDELKWLYVGKIKSDNFSAISQFFPLTLTLSNEYNNNNIKWAFNHKDLILDVIVKYFKLFGKTLEIK